MKNILFFLIAALATVYSARAGCVDFSADKTEVYRGEPVTIKALADENCTECGADYEILSYSWNIAGSNGNINNSPGPHKISFNEIGNFDASLTVTYYVPNSQQPVCTKSIKKSFRVKPKSSTELESFEASPSGSEVKLYWTTLYEQGNEYFSIEKSSDNINFQELAIHESTGDHSTKTIYNVDDKNPSPGANYYRLIRKGKDGSKKILASVQASWYDMNKALNYQNGEKVLIIVDDGKGNEVYSKVVLKSMDSDSIYAVDPANKLLPGTYTIVGSSKNEIHNKMLVIN